MIPGCDEVLAGMSADVGDQVRQFALLLAGLGMEPLQDFIQEGTDRREKGVLIGLQVRTVRAGEGDLDHKAGLQKLHFDMIGLEANELARALGCAGKPAGQHPTQADRQILHSLGCCHHGVFVFS